MNVQKGKFDKRKKYTNIEGGWFSFRETWKINLITKDWADIENFYWLKFLFNKWQDNFEDKNEFQIIHEKEDVHGISNYHWKTKFNHLKKNESNSKWFHFKSNPNKNLFNVVKNINQTPVKYSHTCVGLTPPSNKKTVNVKYSSAGHKKASDLSKKGNVEYPIDVR